MQLLTHGFFVMNISVENDDHGLAVLSEYVSTRSGNLIFEVKKRHDKRDARSTNLNIEDVTNVIITTIDSYMVNNFIETITRE